MAQHVRDLMTTDPVTLAPDTTAHQAAQVMRDSDIGAVLVGEEGQLRGIVTDRDLVVRALADRGDLSDCYLNDICSGQLITASPDEELDSAIQRMRQHAVRRIPVVEGERPVGVLSVGDAAIDRDSESALADISAAEGNT
ncbi:CBS domain-containing protein [Nocardia ignorata]|uniref:CBS domain-containing protein n=1 Tax=Nocardia ignorata TaxID=145285 RepID=UPI003634B405